MECPRGLGGCPFLRTETGDRATDNSRKNKCYKP